MQTKNHEDRTSKGWLTRSVDVERAAFPLKITLILLIAMSVWTASAGAQTLIGASGAGWQTWNLAQDTDGNFIDLNSNGYPYWDVPFLAFGQYDGNPANKSVGWCMTSTGDCQGMGSALFAPGPLPFWGMLYDAASDTGGAMDPTMYFRTTRSSQSYQATLYLNTATNTQEINEFGWFQTNSTGTLNGTKHVIFRGSGYPPGTQTPDSVGKIVTFTPTQYFGFYYSDVSDPETLNGPEHGCYAYTIFTFNDEDCTAAGTPANGTGQGDHNFAIFLQQSPGQVPVYWVAGQDPSMCNHDGDCNLTVVRVRRSGSTN
jgi:hypothetical protein